MSEEPRCLWAHTAARLTRLQIAPAPLTVAKLVKKIIFHTIWFASWNGFLVWLATAKDTSWVDLVYVGLVANFFVVLELLTLPREWRQREEIGRRYREVYGPCEKCASYITARKERERW